MDRKTRINRILYLFVLLSFILPLVYLFVRVILFDDASQIGFFPRTRGDYILMMVQCFLGIIVLHLPTFLARRFKFEIPHLLYIFYIVFLYCAIFLGEVQSFYYIIPFWDTILHGCSAVMTGLLGYMFVVILNREEKVAFSLSPAFCAVFAFGFAVSVGVIWEIYEFTVDSILGLNMQKYMTESGEIIAGRGALLDTMEDLITDVLGALVAAVVGYFSIKRGGGYREGILAVHILSDEEVEKQKAEKAEKKEKKKKRKKDGTKKAPDGEDSLPSDAPAPEEDAYETSR